MLFCQVFLQSTNFKVVPLVANSITILCAIDEKIKDIFIQMQGEELAERWAKHPTPDISAAVGNL